LRASQRILKDLAEKQNNDPRPLSFAYGALGLAATARGDLKAAVEHLAKSRAMFQQAGDAGIASQAAAWMGTVNLLIGDVKAASESATAGLNEAIAAGDRLANVSCRYCLARIALTGGRASEAVDHLLASIAPSVAIEDRGSLSFVFELLGVVAAQCGTYTSSALLFGASDAIHEAVGHRGHTYYLPDAKGIAKARAKTTEALGAEKWQFAYDQGKQAAAGGGAAESPTLQSAFDDLLSVVANSSSSTAQVPIAAPASVQPTSGAAFQVRFFEEDDSVFIGQEYLVKGIPGRLLWRMLKLHEAEGRTEFTNRELRLDAWLKLPDYKDNLEARLLLLSKRLEEKKTPLRLERPGRGRLKLVIEGIPTLSETAAPAPSS